MGRNQWFGEDEDLDWNEIEKVTRNFKGSADEIEEILIDELRPTRKKKRRQDKFHSEEG